MDNRILIYELRIDASPESIVTDSLDEACNIIRKTLTAEPRASPVLIKIRRTTMTDEAFRQLPDANE